MGHGPAAWASSGTLLEIHNLRPYPRPTVHESSVEQNLQKTHPLINIWESLSHSLLPKLVSIMKSPNCMGLGCHLKTYIRSFGGGTCESIFLTITLSDSYYKVNLTRLEDQELESQTELRLVFSHAAWHS